MKKNYTLILLFVTCTFVNAQYTKLFEFTGNGAFNGRNPNLDQNFISDGTYLYGMTSNGGSDDAGTIFKVMPNGTSYTVLFNFNYTTAGSNPKGSLYFDGTFLYGTTSSGGLNNNGTIFKIKPDGTGFLTLLHFNDANGSDPYGSLISDGTFLYGTTNGGGNDDYGTVFKIMPDGTGFQTIVHFDDSNLGSEPYGSLSYDGAFLYGMTYGGGDNSNGTIFKVKPDGTADTTLFSFDASATGSYPQGSLLLNGSYLYGMTNQGGANDYGTVFKIMTDGTAFDTIMNFNESINGKYPYGSLISDGTFLYGMTSSGGANSYGTIFKIKPDRTSYAKLMDFADNPDGSRPNGSLFLQGTFLFGMTSSGGINGDGTLFKIMTDGSNYLKFPDFSGPLNGFNPRASLFFDGTYLYGTARYGGVYNSGVVYKIKPDGTGYTRLHDFDGTINGYDPMCTLVSDGTYLYGMTRGGGAIGAGFGIIFKVKTDGSGFSKLYDFDNANTGAFPFGSLIIDNSVLYGMTTYGGTNDGGTIFSINADGSAFTKLKDFTDTINGRNPEGSLMLDGNFLYGMTTAGGDSARGILFKIQKNGSGFAKLHDFGVATADGRFPKGSLIINGDTLYGMTSLGGTMGYTGTIFRIQKDGTGYTKLHDFGIGSDGYYPLGSLLLTENNLYGMTYNGGFGGGIIFNIKPDGTNYTKLMEFKGSSTGYNPFGSFIAENGFLYGTTLDGGAKSLGTIFKYKYYNSGAALNFDGVDDKVNIGNSLNTILSASNKITVEAWVKPTTNTGNGCIVGNHGTSVGNMQFLLRRDAANFAFYVDNGTGFQSVVSAATSTVDAWQHVAGTWDGTTLSIYVNGVLSGTTAWPGTNIANNTNPIWFGANNLNENFNGSLDEVRIWNKVLCQREIQNNMVGEIATTSNGLLANYHFNQGEAEVPNPSVTTLTDASASALTGTLTAFALTGTTSNWVAPGGVASGNTVTAFVSPNISITGVDNICSGTTTTLTAMGNVVSYAWTLGPNSATNNVSPSFTATYSVTGTDSDGCVSNTATKTVTVNALPVVTASASNVTICNGQSTTLTGGGALTYVWDKGVIDGVPFSPNSSNGYLVIGTDANGCSGIATQNVYVNALPDLTITVNGLVITSNETGATYQWINCANNTAINGETAQSYTATTNGNYACVITKNDCADTSNCVSITTVGIKNNSSENLISIYPNPSNGVFTITAAQPQQIIITNQLGQQVYNTNTTTNTNTINLSHLANGVYSIKAQTADGFAVIKYIKH